MKSNLWTINNPKTLKGEAAGYLTAVLHLSPFTLGDGRRNVCPHASEACIAACLNTAGHGGIIKRGESTNAVQEARKRRTHAFWKDRKAFAAQLVEDARKVARMAERKSLHVAFRLNGTSDLDWHRIAPDAVAKLRALGTLYDYTKDALKAVRMADPIDYTLSWSGQNEDACLQALATESARVAVVFDVKRGADLPKTWRGFIVVDGDEHDLCFLNPRGVLVGLRAKGKARSKGTPNGFIISV